MGIHLSPGPLVTIARHVDCGANQNDRFNTARWEDAHLELGIFCGGEKGVGNKRSGLGEKVWVLSLPEAGFHQQGAGFVPPPQALRQSKGSYLLPGLRLVRDGHAQQVGPEFGKWVGGPRCRRYQILGSGPSSGRKMCFKFQIPPELESLKLTHPGVGDVAMIHVGLPDE